MSISNFFVQINSFDFVCVFEIKNDENDENEKNEENEKDENEENEEKKKTMSLICLSQINKS